MSSSRPPRTLKPSAEELSRCLESIWRSWHCTHGPIGGRLLVRSSAPPRARDAATRASRDTLPPPPTTEAASAGIDRAPRTAPTKIPRTVLIHTWPPGTRRCWPEARIQAGGERGRADGYLSTPLTRLHLQGAGPQATSAKVLCQAPVGLPSPVCRAPFARRTDLPGSQTG